jgi:hypothetical protein
MSTESLFRRPLPELHDSPSVAPEPSFFPNFEKRKLHIGFSSSHSIKSPPEIEIAEGFPFFENLSAM